MARHFDDWIQGYLSYTFDSEAPDQFHWWTAISTIAGALQRKVWINQRIFQWTPNFYIIFVGPAGVVTKSTSLDLGMRFLRKIGASFGPPSMTWQALIRSLKDAMKEDKWWDADGTELKMIHSCLTIPVSELGTFLHPDDSTMMNVLTDLWDGKTDFGHKTVTAGEITVQNPWMNIIGCTTPDWLEAHFPPEMIGGGLTSRIVFVYADKKRKLVAYPGLERPDADFKSIEEQLFMDLAEISTLKGEYRLTDAAVVWGRQWYQEHHDTKKRAAHLANSRYGGYIARKQTHIHKLAIVLTAARSSKLLIEQPVLELAAKAITLAEPDMQRVFESIGQSAESQRVEFMVGYARALSFVPTAKLWQLCQRQMEYRDFQTALKAAVEGQRLRAVSFPDEQGNSILGVMPI